MMVMGNKMSQVAQRIRYFSKFEAGTIRTYIMLQSAQILGHRKEDFLWPDYQSVFYQTRKEVKAYEIL